MSSTTTPSYVSERGMQTFRPPLSYFRVSAELQNRIWSKEDQGGNIIIAVAENKLSSNLVYERLMQCSPPPSRVLAYPTCWTGSEPLRKAVAVLLQRTNKGLTIDPAHITIMSGATAIIENLFWCICDSGQGVLIPAPYYPAFDNDLTVKGNLTPLPFQLDESKGVAEQLTSAADAAAARGSPVKALLLTNPNNPLSTMYKRDTLVGALKWCMEHEVHLISDEIYAFSVWGEDAPCFESLEKIAHEEAESMPGGEARAIGNVVYCSNAPGYTQSLMTEVLEDGSWLDGFFIENTRRLRQAYGLLAEALTNADIPFVPANSAMFCWIDLREGLGSCTVSGKPSWEEEEKFWEELAYKYGVLLTPGKLCHADEPGFFRMCWAWVPEEALPVAVKRIRTAIDNRKLGSINENSLS